MKTQKNKSVDPRHMISNTLIKPGEEVPLEQIDLDENHRVPHPDDLTAIESLAESIRSAGQQTSGRVYCKPDFERLMKAWKPGAPPEKRPYLMGFGYRRYKGLEKNNIPFFRADVFSQASPADIEVARGIENLQREDLNPASRVLLISRLMNLHDGDVDVVAGRIGWSVTKVRTHIHLQKLDSRVMQLVGKGRLHLGHARLIAQIGDPEVQCKIAGQAVRQWNFQNESEPAAGMSICSIDQLQEMIASETRSLANVSWGLEQRFPATDEFPSLPACLGCQHNTLSDPLLFEGAGDPKSEAGHCMFGRCFAQKEERCQARKEEVVAKVEMEIEKAIKKDKPVGSLASMVKADIESTPWMKPGSITRAVQKAAEAKHPSEPQGTEKQRRHAALLEFSKALDLWRGKVAEQIWRGLADRPAATVIFAMLVPRVSFKPWAECNYRVDTHNWGISKLPIEPNAPHRLVNEQLDVIELIAQGDANAAIKLSERGDFPLEDVHGQMKSELAMLPMEALIHFCNRLGIAPQPLSAPQFNDFLPEDLRVPALVGQAGVTMLAVPEMTSRSGKLMKPAVKPQKQGPLLAVKPESYVLDIPLLKVMEPDMQGVFKGEGLVLVEIPEMSSLITAHISLALSGGEGGFHWGYHVVNSVTESARTRHPMALHQFKTVNPALLASCGEILDILGEWLADSANLKERIALNTSIDAVTALQIGLEREVD